MFTHPYMTMLQCDLNLAETWMVIYRKEFHCLPLSVGWKHPYWKVNCSFLQLRKQNVH